MSVLVIKLGATGDVSLYDTSFAPIERFGHVDHRGQELCVAGWPRGQSASFPLGSACARPRYSDNLLINLEDSLEVAHFLKNVTSAEIFGAYADSSDCLCYTNNSKRWFDLSLISSYGRREADRLKFLNRQTYQELIFEGLGLRFPVILTCFRIRSKPGSPAMSQ